MKKLYFLIIYTLLTTTLIGQNKQFFLENFLPEGREDNYKIWSIVQDHRGIMYFGSDNLSFEYDGVNWRTINMGAKALNISKDGVVYWGGMGNFGYLQSNEFGETQFYSLLSEIDSAYHQFTDIWTISISGDNVYFSAAEYFFRYNPKKTPKIKVISENKDYFLSYQVRDEVFLSFMSDGIYKVEGDSLIRIPELQTANAPWAMLPYGNDKYLMILTDYDFFVWDPNNSDSTKIISREYFDPAEAQKTKEFFYDNGIYLGAAQLSDTTYAISTISGGIALINNKGKIINVVNKKNKLSNNTVHYLYTDNNKQLWAGLAYGLAYLETHSPLTFYNEYNGIYGNIYDVFRTDKHFFGTTNVGIFCLENEQFKEITDVEEANVEYANPDAFKIPNSDKKLYTITSLNSMFKVEGKKIIKLNRVPSVGYFQSKYDSNKIWIDYSYTIEEADLQSELKQHKVVAKLDFNPFIISEYDENIFWTIKDSSIFLYDLNNKKLIDFHNNKEIDDIEFYSGKEVEAGVLFFTNKGIYTYDKSQNKFLEYDKKFNLEIMGTEVLQLEELSKNEFLVLYKKNNNRYINSFGNSQTPFIRDTVALKRISNFTKFYIDDSLLWLIDAKALYQFNTKFKKDYSVKNNVLIRKISTSDSVIFYGMSHKITPNNQIVDTLFGKENPFVLEYKNNNLKIEFALPEYENRKKNMYSYRLQGRRQNGQWSKWTYEDYKEISNISEGKYVFQVKGRNIYGFESGIAEFYFVVEPPFYRTIYAYIFYIILFITFVWLVIRRYSKYLKQENTRLDRIVTERTAELVEKNDEITTYLDSLEKANIEIKNKNKLIASSINYAKRIQEAMFPKSERLDKTLKEYFILDMPKDVVTGDFYWVEKYNDNLVIVVADSTGHGIAGGFIGMLGISMLNHAINKKSIENPAAILEKMRKMLKDTFKQKDFLTSNNDVVEMGLLVINQKTNNLIFSGAFVPLYIVRNKQLITLDAILNPVGIYLREKPFENKTFTLENNDVIYMFSDGYKDQLNENNNIYSSKKLKQLLIDNAHKDMKTQKQILLDNLQKWKKETPQTDDITVFGLRWKQIEN